MNQKAMSLLLLFFTITFFLGCSQSISDGSSAKHAAGSAVLNRIQSPSISGTRENPIAIGNSAMIGDWNVTIVNVIENAIEIVKEKNLFTDPPEPGMQYIMIEIKGKFVGKDAIMLCKK